MSKLLDVSRSSLCKIKEVGGGVWSMTKSRVLSSVGSTVNQGNRRESIRGFIVEDKAFVIGHGGGRLIDRTSGY